MHMLASFTQPRRRGFGLAEVAISAVLISVALTLVAQIVITLASERTGTDRRQRAVQEAANLMERLTSRSWDDLTTESTQGLSLSSATLNALPNGSLKLTITPVSGVPASKKITVEIGWNNRSSGRESPVRLIGWVYQIRGAKP